MKKNRLISFLYCLFLFCLMNANGRLYAQKVVSEIQIASLQNRPIIAGLINGKKAYFLLDTGATISILHEGVARHFGFRHHSLNYAESARFISIMGQQSEMNRAFNAKVLLGGVLIKTAFYTYDFSTIRENTRNLTNYSISGIIGADIMKRYGFQIDYKNRSISLHHKPPKSSPIKAVNKSIATTEKK